MRRLLLVLAVPAVLILVAGSPGRQDRNVAPPTRSQFSPNELINTLYFLGAFPPRNTPATENVAKRAPKKNASRIWTPEEALSQLALQPKDSYLQFVALQLARRESKVEEAVSKIAELRLGENERLEGVDLFSIFSGALAVQESLQLDTMQGRPPRSRPFQPQAPPELEGQPAPEPGGQNPSDGDETLRAKRRQEVVALSDLQGPAIKSHPWKQMLRAKTGPGSPPFQTVKMGKGIAAHDPPVGRLSRCVPEDFYYVEFRVLSRLLDTLDVTSLWSTHLFSQGLREARTSDTSSRIQTQLALEITPPLKTFLDLVVEEVAVTGSDLYVREGSDVTMIFRFNFRQPTNFPQRMDDELAKAEKNRSGVRRSTGKYLGVEYVHLETSDKAVNVYSAYPVGGLHIRSNSRVGFERVLQAIRGQNPQGQPVRRLGDSDEFAYIRTLMPRGAPEEDGFIYLSDPFIRHQVGPQMKLTERRRTICYNHLRMIGHAALLYHTETGRWPDSLQALIQAKCLPSFDAASGANFACPDGGAYTLSPDHTCGECSRHGHTHLLTPNCELPLTKVNGQEADEYRDFLREYNEYWRTYFDPIAIRIQAAPEHYRLETIVLPLINNSIYKSLAETLGGSPEPLDAQPILDKTIFSLNLRLNKERLVKEMQAQFGQGAQPSPETIASWIAMTPSGSVPAALPWIGMLAGAQNENDPEEDILSLRAWGVPEAELKKLTLSAFRNLVDRGFGNQVSLHLCDAPPLFDINPAVSLGAGMPNVASILPSESALSDIVYSSLVSLLNTPFYLSIPVQDPKIVDDFLAMLDPMFAVAARKLERSGQIQYEFYKFQSKQDPRVIFRGNALRYGPIKGRLFSARIGNTFYLTSKPHTLLEDLVAAHKREQIQVQSTEEPKTRDAGPIGHAMIRVRPENWNQVLTDYRLGWADNNRQACLNNLGPLASVARAFTAPLNKLENTELDALSQRACQQADRVHGTHFFCPEGGTYRLAPDGKTMTCSVHGTVLDPRQPTAPSDRSGLGSLMTHFKGMTTTLTFTEDGLRAVMTIERK
jgi:hypothetical protein